MVYTTHKNGDEWGMVYYCYTNIIGIEYLDFHFQRKLKACLDKGQANDTNFALDAFDQGTLNG